jgi:hypothetical protein
MGGYQLLALIAGLSLAACTSDPNAPVNQTFPIRQMDRFFDSLSAPPETQGPIGRSSAGGALQTYTRPPPPDYTREPGYAPAYPTYDQPYE